MYALGLGASPTPTHAAILQRLFESTPDAFNFTHVETWLRQSGNPPLMHMPVLAGFFDGLYVLAENFGLDANVVDARGASTLHAATWEGRIDMIQLLLSFGANVTAVDHRGRNVLHYAVLRGFADVISFIHYNMTQPILARPKPGSGHTQVKEIVNKLGKRRFCKLAEMRDTDGRTAMDLAGRKPAATLAAEVLVNITNGDCKGLMYSVPPTVEPAESESEHPALKIPIECAERTCNFRGGWFYPKGAPSQHPGDGALAVDRIDGLALDPSQFYVDYVSTQKPAVITNGATLSDQRIWAYWERDDFLARYGDQLLVRGDEQYFGYYDRLDIAYWSQVYRRQVESLELTVSEWVARMEYSSSARRKGAMSCCMEEAEDGDNDEGGAGKEGSSAAARVRYNAWNSPWMAHSVDPSSRAELLNRRQRNEAAASLDAEKEYIREKTGSATVNVHFNSIVDDSAVSGGAEADDNVWKADLEPVSLFTDICTLHRASSAPFNDDCSADETDQQCGVSVDDMPYSVFIGPMNSSVPIQAHNSSWEILVTGLKKWYLMPPGHSIYAFTSDINKRLANTSYEADLTQFILPIPEWLARHGNQLIRRGLVHEIIQYPGDIVYIPHNWAYGSVNLADSVSISQEFCTFLNTDQRFYPVGLGLYGGQDRHRRYNHRLEPLTSDLLAAINKPKESIDTNFPQFLQ
jgi:hypothetical protein